MNSLRARDTMPDASRTLSATALAGLAVLAAPASAQGLGSTDFSDVLFAARACDAALTSHGLNERELLAHGWKAATPKDNHGKALPSPIPMYGKNAVTVLGPAKDPKAPHGCVISAPLETVASLGPLRTAMTAAFGQPVEIGADGKTYYRFADRKIAQLALTGSAAEPAARIVVVPSSGETK